MTSEQQQDSPFELQASLVADAVATSMANPPVSAEQSSEPMGMELSGQNGPETGPDLGTVEQSTPTEAVPAASGVEPMELEPATAASASPSGQEDAQLRESCGPAGKASSDSANGDGEKDGKEERPVADATQSQGQRTQSGSTRPRKPHLQGRFSGRLETKDDEKSLQEECRLLGPLVGGTGKRGEKSRMTLAKIVRAIATGEVRRHCVERESRILELQDKLKTIETVYRREAELLKQDNNALRLKLELRSEDFNHRQISHMGVLRGGLKSNSSHEPRVIITPATVPPMVVVRGGNTRYPTADPVTSMGTAMPPVDVSSIPFLFPSTPNAQAQALQGNSPIARGGRMAQLSSVDAAAVAQARTLAHVRSQGEAANSLNLKRKLQEMQGSDVDPVRDAKHEEAMRQRRTIPQAQALADLEQVGPSTVSSAERDEGVVRAFQTVKYSNAPQVLKVVPAQVLPMSQNLSPTSFGSSQSMGLSQQQVAFLSVPGQGDSENRSGMAPTLNVLGTQSGLPAPAGHEVQTPTVALTIGEDMAAHQLAQQPGFSGQKTVIVSNFQAGNAALTSTGPFASQLLSGQIGLDNVLSQVPLTEALATSTAPTVIGGNDMAPNLEDSALSTPMEAEVMDPSILEQLHAGDLGLTTVAAAVPIIQGGGRGTQIVMPAAQVLRMSSEAGRPVG